MTRAAVLVGSLAVLFGAHAAAAQSTPPAAQPPSRTAPGARLGGVRPRSQRPPARPRTTPRPAPSPDSARPAPPPDFSYRAGGEKDTVTVGDRFVSALFVRTAAGSRLEMEIPKDSADRWRVIGSVRPTALDSARTRWTVMVPMTAWLPGFRDSVRAMLKVTPASGAAARVPIVLAFPTVRATLPADSSQWRVRPPHDVWGASYDAKRIGFAALLGLLLLALLAALVAWLLRRRRRRRVPATARERALQRLDEAGRSGLIEAGNWKGFYTLVSDAVRAFAAEMEPRWSADLTTAELLETMAADRVPADSAESLRGVLDAADLAKFARRGCTPDEARADLAAARGWVERFELPRAEPITAEAAP